MTPVLQTKLYTPDGIHNGNCFAACLASLLDLPLWMVPPFEDMFGRDDSYLLRVNMWLMRMFKQRLQRVDWTYDYASGKKIDPVISQVDKIDTPYFIGSGLSARGVRHSVIFQKSVNPGECIFVHDPHFSGTGIKSIEWSWHLVDCTENELRIQGIE